MAITVKAEMRSKLALVGGGNFNENYVMKMTLAAVSLCINALSLIDRVLPAVRAVRGDLSLPTLGLPLVIP